MSLITDTKSLSDICEKLAAHDFLTIDTEFLREKTYYPKLCLVQLAGPGIDAVAVDPLADGIDMRPLYDLLGNEKVRKVFHAARQDLEIFYNLTNDVPLPLFDTQVAAMVCGHGESIGYSNLINELCGVRLDKGAQFTDWSRRPLTDKQLSYALDDVTYLRDAYLKLQQELKERGREDWVLEEMDILRAPETYQNLPEDAWKRIKIRSDNPKTLAVLRAIGTWREEEAQRRNVPRPWVLRDDTMIDIAVHAPKDTKSLARARNFSKDQANGKIGQAILSLTQKALSQPKEDWPKIKKKERFPVEHGPALEMLKMLLRIQAGEHAVAQKLIASSKDLEVLAAEDKPDIPAMKGWRYKVFGQEAEALKNGKLALSIKDQKIHKAKL